MQIRKLVKILGECPYIIADYGEYLGIGSNLCHDLIKVTKKNFKLTYALAMFNSGREALVNANEPILVHIWDKLTELINSGKINEIFNNNDELSIKIPVFYVDYDFNIIESYTDKFEWPNTTYDGKLINSECFKTKKEAINHALYDLKYYTSTLQESITELTERLNTSIGKLNKNKQIMTELSQELKNF
jgi:hypothetical protein